MYDIGDKFKVVAKDSAHKHITLGDILVLVYVSDTYSWYTYADGRAPRDDCAVGCFSFPNKNVEVFPSDKDLLDLI